MQPHLIPDPAKQLQLFENFLTNKTPFTFIRFSDGEIEILRNRYLEISGGKTVFRGRVLKNNYPQFDAKRFDPTLHQNIRSDLLAAAMLRGHNFFKGIPTRHNEALDDREFLLRLNGGFSQYMTFADLLLNSNFADYRNRIVPLFATFDRVYVIANFRAKPADIIAKASLISVPDNFFATYDEALSNVMSGLKGIEPGSLVLSSASSLTKIVGHQLFMQRQDVTYLDIGTSINDLLSLPHNTRGYHLEGQSWFYRQFPSLRKGFQLRW